MSNETKFTPRPWFADASCYSKKSGADPDMMDYSTSVECVAPFTENEFSDTPYETVERQNCARVFGRNVVEMAANAHLIAAAPEMYDEGARSEIALRAAAAQLRESGHPVIADMVLAQADKQNAVLKKARGEQ